MREITQRDRVLRPGGAVDGPERKPPALHHVAAQWRAPDAQVAGSAKETLPPGNVIAFRRSPREEASVAPAVALGTNGRPAPAAFGARRLPYWMILLSVSAAAHLGLYLPFRQPPTPMASLGEVSVSVDLVLGADQHAGLVPDKGTAQASAPTPAQAPEITDTQTPPELEPAEVAPIKTAVAEQETAPPERQEVAPAENQEAKPLERQAEAAPTAEAKPAASPEATAESTSTVIASVVPDAVAAIRPVTPVEPVAEATPAPAPVQAVPQAEAATPAELQVSTMPLSAEATAAPERPAATEAEKETLEVAVADTAEPTDVTSVVLPKQATTPPERPEPRQARPTPKREQSRKTVREWRPQRAATRGERNRSRNTSPAAAAAGGVGRGRSDANSNYRGLVAAHLARHKRFPDAARSRGSQGSAVVTFALDGGGRVTSVRVTRGSGVASLDQEAAAMVRRASPFPAPPNGSRVSFTVPVSFRLN